MRAPKRRLYEFGSYQLNPEEHVLMLKGEIVHLTPKAFDVLKILIENNGHVVDKEYLLDEVWEDTVVEEANVSKLISTLRQVLSGNGLAEPFIVTIPKRGYRFVADVSEVKAPSPVSEHVSQDARSLPGKILLAVGITLLLSVLALGIFFYSDYFDTVNSGSPNYEVFLLTDDGFSRNPAISPDGKVFAFVVIKDGTRKMMIRRIATGATAEIIPPTNQQWIGQIVFSPDSEFIYFSGLENNQRTLYRVPVLGGQIQNLFGGIQSEIDFSPDGKSIVFNGTDPHDNGNKIFIGDKQAQNLKPVVSNEGAGLDIFQGVLWSSDGTRLLLTGYRNEGDSSRKFKAVWVEPNGEKIAEAAEFKPLIAQNWFNIEGFIRPRGGSGLIFLGMRNVGDRQQIFHFSPSDGKITPIVSDTDDYYSVRSTENGASLVADKVDRYSDMILFDPETGNERMVLEKNKSFMLESGFTQMSDGRLLVTKAIGKGIEICAVNMDGSGETQLTSNERINSYPIATPDGKYIIFVSKEPGDGKVWFGELWRMKADGTEQVQLTDDPAVQVNEIDLSPDGSTVFYDRQSPDRPVSRRRKTELMKISIMGGKPVPLFPSGKIQGTRPLISPDGSLLAFAGADFSGEKPKAGVFIYAMNGNELGEFKKRIEGVLLGAGFDWTPDSKSLTFIKRRSGPTHIRNVDINSENQTKIAELGPTGWVHWARDGKHAFIVRRYLTRNIVIIKTTGDRQ